MAGRVNTPRETAKRERVQALVSGAVQGVGFRQATYWEARQLGLIGWVRNLDDGRVEVSAEGEARKVAVLLKWLAKGPSSAKVEKVDVVKREKAATTDGGSFEILR